MYDRILLPIDDHAGTQRATAQAIALAELTGASVYALYIINERTYESLDANARADRDATGRDALATVCNAVPDDIPVEAELRYGVAHRDILSAASDIGADVIVVGTCGRTGIDRVLAGSVAELVTRHASVPVLTVGAADETDATNTGETDATADSTLERTRTAVETAAQTVADALAEPYRTTT